MFRSFALMAGAAAIAVAPLTAQAAAYRVGAPITAESEEVRGSPFLAPIIIAVIVALAIVATTSGDDPQSP